MLDIEIGQEVSILSIRHVAEDKLKLALSWALSAEMDSIAEDNGATIRRFHGDTGTFGTIHRD